MRCAVPSARRNRLEQVGCGEAGYTGGQAVAQELLQLCPLDQGRLGRLSQVLNGAAGKDHHRLQVETLRQPAVLEPVAEQPGAPIRPAQVDGTSGPSPFALLALLADLA
jgi:hypothetical protein